MEPTKITVKEESQFKGGAAEFVPTKLVTRLTYTLDQVRSRSASHVDGSMRMLVQRWRVVAPASICLPYHVHRL